MSSALDYLGITPPGNPLSSFFPQAGGDDAFRSQLEERPQGRTRIPPELALASQLPDPSGFLQQVQQFRGQNESKQLIGELQNLDFGKPEYPASVAKLLGKYPNAAQNPIVQGVLKMKEFSGQQARQSQYNDQASKALKGLYSLRPDDPDHDDKLKELTENLPDEVFQNPRFASTYERALHNSDMIRSKKTADQQSNQMLDRELLKVGKKPGSYSSLEDKQDALAEVMQQSAQRKEVQDAFRADPKLRDKYVDALMAINSPITDEDKINAAGKTKASEMTPQDWTSTHAKVYQGRIRDLNNVYATFAAMGLAPNRFGGPPDASDTPSGTIAPPTGSSAPAGIPAPSTALPADQSQTSPVIAPNVTPTASVSPADLTKGDLYGTPQNLEQRIEAEKSAAQNQLVLDAQRKQAELAATQRAIDQRGQEVSQMSPAWDSIMQSMTPSDLDRPLEDFADDTFLGDKKINPQTVLFNDAKGRPVFMRDAVREFRMSPKFDALKAQRNPAPIIPKNIISIKQIK